MTLLLLSALAGPKTSPPEVVPVCKEGENAFVGGKQGWLFRPPDMVERFSLDLTVMQRAGRLVSAMQSRGSELVVYVVPTRPMVQLEMLAPDSTFDADLAARTYADLNLWLRGLGVLPVDLLTPALAAEEPFYHRTDQHWTVDGAQLSAKAVAQAIKGSERWKGTPRREHTTAYVRTEKGRAPLAEALHETCGGKKLPPERYPVYETTAAPIEGLGLLDEVPPPPVVSLSSSFGRSVFNFNGFLAENLGAEVVGVRVGAGGAIGAAFDYLHSADWRTAPSRFVVWEWLQVVLSQEASPNAELSFGDADMYRELIGAALGDCEKPSVQKRVRLDGTRQNLAAELGSRGLRGPGGRIVLEMDAPLNELTLVSRYADGHVDRFTFSDYERVERNQRFYLELSDGSQAALLRVDALTPDGTNVAGQLTICSGD